MDLVLASAWDRELMFKLEFVPTCMPVRYMSKAVRDLHIELQPITIQHTLIITAAVMSRTAITISQAITTCIAAATGTAKLADEIVG
jgi:PIN domain nuclease of toxin-antitoxin system